MQPTAVNSGEPRLEHIALSENETALWLDCIKHPDFAGHLLPIYFHFEPEPGPDALQAALDSLLTRFPKLAMRIAESDGVPVFMRCESPKITRHTLAQFPSQDRLMQLAFAVMPLGEASLMEWHCFQIGNAKKPHTRHLLRCHHLLGDQQSVAGLWQALAQALSAEPAVKAVIQARTLSQNELQPSEVIAPSRWQVGQLKPALLPDFDAPLTLPSGLALSAFASLSSVQSRAIQQAAKAQSLSTFELMLAAYANSLDDIYGAHPRILYLPALSQQKSGQYDVCTAALLLEPIEVTQTGATSELNRAHKLAAQVRTRSANQPAITAQTLKHGIVYSRAPHGTCTTLSGLSSNVECHRINLGKHGSKALCMVLHRLPAQPAPFASCAQIYQWDDCLHLSIQLDTALFSDATAAFILASWQTHIERMIDANSRPGIDCTSSNVLPTNQRTAHAGSISVLLANAAVKYANCIALDDGVTKLSYRQLERYCSEKLTLPNTLESSPSVTQAVQCYVALRLEKTLDFRVNPSQILNGAHCAVIFSSSGTTSKPAVIQLSSANLAAYAESMVPMLALKPGDRVLRFASSAFDAVLEELLISFLSGATLVCPIDAHSGQSIEARFESFPMLSKRLAMLEITALNVGTSWWHAAVLDGMTMPACIRQMVIGGEAASIVLWQQFSAAHPRIDLVNTYGLTEACVSQFIFRGSFDARQKFVPIGAPLSHVDAAIFNADTNNRAGVLEPGELCLSGASLGETSRVDRYFEHTGKRYLRTGDRVVQSARGALHYLGRLNRTIKHLGKQLDLDALGAQASRLQTELDTVAAKVHALLVSEQERQSQIVLVHENLPTAALRVFAKTQQAALFQLQHIPYTAGGKPDFSKMQDAVLQVQPADQKSDDEIVHDAPHSDVLSALIRAIVSVHFDDATPLSEILSSLDWLRLRGAIEQQFGVQLKAADHGNTVGKLRQILHLAEPPLTSISTDALQLHHKPNHSQLHSGFFQAAAQFPEALALVTPEKSLSYRELLAQTVALVAHMQQAGVIPGARVAFSATRSAFDVLAMLAISASGAVFVPLSTAMKNDALAQRIEQVGVNFWLHEGKLRSMLEPLNSEVSNEIADLAYILLTSGSSGAPKAVAMTHAAASNTLNDLIYRLTLRPTDRVLALSPTQFDLSIFDVFATLSVGATLVWPDELKRRDASFWPQLIKQHAITIWNSVPSSLNLLLAAANDTGDQLVSLRQVLLSGDFVSQTLIQKAFHALPNAEISVLGGATEAGIWSCIFDARQIGYRKYAPYGAALSGQQLMVDAERGEVGEIIITGKSVAAGYLQAGKLAQRFCDDSGAARYATGDLGRLLSDDSIEILGRQDAIVKWRGLRVSVADIEAQLLSEPGIQQAAVIGLEASLVAAVVLEKSPIMGSEFDTDALIARLKHRFADSDKAAPDRYEIFSDALPLSANGKLDRIALKQLLQTWPAAGAMAITTHTVLAHTVQTPIAHPSALALWQQFLPSDANPETGDWFSQGGHSLQALKLIEAARLLGAEKATLGGFLRQPTLQRLSNWFALQQLGISQSINTSTLAIDTAELEPVDIAALSRIQDAILVTGATGMLAIGLIKELLAHTTRPLILCVRGKTPAIAKQRMVAAISATDLELARIQVLQFDLAEPDLGWPTELFDVLGGAVSEIWHLGAEVNFLLSESELAASNIHSSDAIFELAKQSGALLHFASSLGVFPYQLAHDVNEHSERPAGLFASGYASSKWQAEQRLRALADQSKTHIKPVRLRIYRLGLCVAEHPRAQDIVGMSRTALDLCNSWPDSPLQINALAQSDAVSALLTLAEFDPGSADIQTWHIQNDQSESIDTLHAQIQPSAPKIALFDWLAKLNLSKHTTLNPEAELARDMLLLIPAGAANADNSGGQVLATHTQAVLKANGWQPQSVANALRPALLEYPN